MKSRAYVPADSSFPFLGLDTISPRTMKDPRYSPDCENVVFSKGRLMKRKGYNQLGTTLAGTIKALVEFETYTGIKRLVCITSRSIYYYDGSSDAWEDISGSVEVDDFETNEWTTTTVGGTTNVSTDAQLGTYSLEITNFGSSAGTGEAAHRNPDFSPALDWSGMVCMMVWIKSSIALDAGDIAIYGTEDGDPDSGFNEDLPAIPANEWTHVRLPADFTGLNAVTEVGLIMKVDKGEQPNGFTFMMDDLRVSPVLGSDDDLVDWVVATDESGTYLIYTNGVDNPQKWDGVTSTISDLTINASGFEACKCLGVINNYLFLGNIKTSGNWDHKGVMWSETGDFTEWTTGNSGAAIVPTIKGEIIKFVPFADRLAIYGKESISLITYVGGSVTFGFETVVTDTSVLSAQGIVNLGGMHIYLGRGNIYLFDGSSFPRAVGDRIVRKYQQDLDLSNAELAFGFVDLQNNRVYFGIPTGDTSAEIILGEFDLGSFGEFRWSVLTYPGAPRAMGYYSSQSTLGWNSDVLTDVAWQDSTWTWDETSSGASYPIPVMGTIDTVYFLTGTSSLDGTTDIESYWCSIDFSVPQFYKSRKGRWQEIEIEAIGSSLEVQYTTDHGKNYTSLETLELSADFEKQSVYLDVVSDSLGIRLVCNGSDTFELQWLRIWLKEGSSR